MKMFKVNNKRIAKNTLMLYLRMLLVMAVSLFTVRIVLQALGQIDYGLYNVVGGIVVLFSFLSHVLSSASQRFFAFELGRNDNNRLSNIYSIILMLYGIVIAIIVVLAETVGLWFLTTHMVIPPDRMVAVKWVYQMSIAAFCIQIIVTPHKAIVIAKEHMHILAYVSIIEVTLQLLLAYTLLNYNGDRLQLYAILMFLVHLATNSFYIVYARRKFPNIHFAAKWDADIVRSIVSYSGWTLFGALASIARSQGINIVLNVYFGAVVNAARGLAHQVNGAVNSFSSNFYTAVKPQIVKSYAAGKREDCVNLVVRSTRFSFCLLMVLTIPIICYTPEILSFWLGNYPSYAVIFVRLMLITCIIDAMGNPIITFNQATGDIRLYQIVVSVIYMLNIPFVIAVFETGFSPVGAFITSMIISIIAQIARLTIVTMKHGFPLSLYCRKALIPLISVTASCILWCVLWFHIMKSPSSFIELIAYLFMTFTLTAICSLFLGFTHNERLFIIETIKKKLQ